MALLAIFLHVVVPTAYEISGPNVAGLMKTIICSGGVATEVYIDGNGKPVHPANSGHQDCKFSCLHHCAALAVSALSVASPSWTILLNVLTGAESAQAHVTSASNPRGPPV
ncbi:DUF2946 family protein [Parvibaculum sp.]|uniref:DUF2946 family protein n=1 Tax=Parvibaculum sp. TaxID=2024848 RepID=UPI00320C2D0D